MRNRILGLVVAGSLALSAIVMSTLPALAASYTPISGEGSSWAANAIQDWAADVHNKGLVVNFAPTGSVAGLTGFSNGTDDFAASDVPFGVTSGGQQVTPPAPNGRPFAYVPDVAGGTALMYNLTIQGQRYTNLKLSGPTIAGIFSGKITTWNAPQIKADNPTIAAVLPATRVTPVVRADGSGSTAQFSLWMSKKFGNVWTCGQVSLFTQCSFYDPTVEQAKSGDNGVAGFVQQAGNNGSIGYVEYSYALQSGFPVAKVLNASGFYVLPTSSNVAVALLKAVIDTTPGVNYLTQQLDGVYADTDPRAYPISSYSYFVVPTSNFDSNKGYTLGAFAQYALCQGQQKAPALGYSPLPINLVEGGLSQVKKIPGAAVANINIQSCNNPTFSTSGVNTLAINALYPDLCDKQTAKVNCVYGTPVQGKTSSSSNGQGDANSVGAHTTSTGSTSSSTTTGTGNTTTGSPTPGVPGSGGSVGANGPSGGSGGSISLTNPDGQTNCDPDTGQCTKLSASPITVPVDHSTFGQWVLWAVLIGLVGLIAVPPALLVLGRRTSR
jgi:phosphate ABC transporter phosphate-binding protein